MFLALLDLIHVVELALRFFAIEWHVEECIQLIILRSVLLKFEDDIFDFFLEIWQCWVQLAQASFVRCLLILQGNSLS